MRLINFLEAKDPLYEAVADNRKEFLNDFKKPSLKIRKQSYSIPSLSKIKAVKRNKSCDCCSFKHHDFYSQNYSSPSEIIYDKIVDNKTLHKHSLNKFKKHSQNNQNEDIVYNYSEYFNTNSNPRKQVTYASQLPPLKNKSAPYLRASKSERIHHIPDDVNVFERLLNDVSSAKKQETRDEKTYKIPVSNSRDILAERAIKRRNKAYQISGLTLKMFEKV